VVGHRRRSAQQDESGVVDGLFRGKLFRRIFFRGEDLFFENVYVFAYLEVAVAAHGHQEEEDEHWDQDEQGEDHPDPSQDPTGTSELVLVELRVGACLALRAVTREQRDDRQDEWDHRQSQDPKDEGGGTTWSLFTARDGKHALSHVVADTAAGGIFRRHRCTPPRSSG
jgi:hypothetical protein